MPVPITNKKIMTIYGPKTQKKTLLIERGTEHLCKEEQPSENPETPVKLEYVNSRAEMAKYEGVRE